MKRTWIIILTLSARLSAFAQGQVNFNTHIPSDTPPVDARFLKPDFTPATAGFGQLVILGNDGSLVPLTPIGALGTSPSEAGYINAGIATAPAGFPGGTTVNLMLLAWLGGPGSTYDTATITAKTLPITVTLEEAPNARNDLIGLTFIPEPTTLALGALGVGAMLFRRRRYKSGGSM